MGFLLLEQWFSKCDILNKSINIMEMFLEKHFLGPTLDHLGQKCREWSPEICVWSVPPGDSGAHSSLRITIVHKLIFTQRHIPNREWKKHKQNDCRLPRSRDQARKKGKDCQPECGWELVSPAAIGRWKRWVGEDIHIVNNSPRKLSSTLPQQTRSTWTSGGCDTGSMNWVCALTHYAVPEGWSLGPPSQRAGWL